MLDFASYPPLLNVSDLPDSMSGVDETLLAAVGEAIRGYCGWHIAPAVTETLTLDHAGNRVVQIPTLHMTAVESVVDAEAQPLPGFTWSEAGMLKRHAWPNGFQAIKATITHGLDAVPAAIVRVAVDMITDQQSADAGPSIGNVQLDAARVDFAVPASDVGIRRRMAYAYGHILGRYKL